MALTQRFILKEGVGGLPGIIICAGPSCLAEPTAAEAGEAITYAHTEACEETRGAAG